MGQRASGGGHIALRKTSSILQKNTRLPVAKAARLPISVCYSLVWNKEKEKQLLEKKLFGDMLRCLLLQSFAKRLISVGFQFTAS